MSRRGYTVTKLIRSQRREKAEQMKEAYDKLSLDEKIAKLPPEPGAKKQRARLMALKEKQKG